MVVFLKVFCETLTSKDYEIILSAMYPQMPQQIISQMVLFNEQV